MNATDVQTDTLESIGLHT